MIKFLETEPGKSGAFFVCDACGERLVDGSAVVAVQQDGTVKTFCKESVNPECDKHNQDDKGWHEIGTLMVQLMTNAKVDYEEATRNQVILHGLGTGT